MATASGARRLPADLALYRTSDARHRLPATFSATTLTMLGIGVMVGGGIFSIAGAQAASTAGPAVILSFVIGAVVCCFAALCYAELSSTLPVSGSVYTYSYVAFGERWAWFAGWSLILELVLAASIVSRLFVQYLISTLDTAGVAIPAVVVEFGSVGSPINLIAPIFLLFLTLLIAYGTKLTGRAVTVLVAVKLTILAAVVLTGSWFVERDNYSPFVPESQPASGPDSMLSALTGLGDTSFGIFGIVAAAGAVVFAYVGFDLISTVAEDARDARRSVPRGILTSFGVVTLLYLTMAVVLVGLRPFEALGSDAPFVDAMRAAGVGTWVAVTVGVGASVGMATVVTVVLFGFSRLLFAMGRDRLLPAELGRVRPGYNAPANAALVGGLAAAVLSIFPKALEFEYLLVLCALFAFLCTAIGVLVLRSRQPDLERGFTIPGGAVVPTLAAISIVWLALTLPMSVWLQFGIWLIVGLIVYFSYGHWHSRLASLEGDEAATVSQQAAPASSATTPHQVVVSTTTDDDQRETTATYTFTWQTHQPATWSEESSEADGPADAPDEPIPPTQSTGRTETHPFWSDTTTDIPQVRNPLEDEGPPVRRHSR